MKKNSDEKLALLTIKNSQCLHVYVCVYVCVYIYIYIYIYIKI